MDSCLKYEDIHPFIRCVGRTTALCQKTFHMAYDYRMIVIVDGNGIIKLKSTEHRTKKGDIFIISPGTPYCVKSEYNQDIIVVNFDMTHINSNINFPVISVSEEFFDDSKIMEKFALPGILGENKCIKKNHYNSISICISILEAYAKRQDVLEIYISGLFMQVLYHMLSEDHEKNTNRAAEKLYGYVTENYHLELTLENIAEEFHFHPTYINRLLKKHYKITFRQLLLKCRFERAMYLLDNTDMPINEISLAVGFNNTQYFSNAFFKHFGYYPSVYRKKS